MELKVAFVARDPAVRLAGAKALAAAPEEWSIEIVEDVPPHADVVVFGPDVPGCDGIRFDPTAEPDAFVDSIADVARTGDVIAVTAACGGSGVTTIALHLARTNASCVVECGARAGLAERLGLNRAELRTWDADDPAAASLDLAALPMRGGFRAYVARTDQWTGVERVVDAARKRFGGVILDVPVGDGLPELCDAAVVVMPATLPAAVRTRAFLDALPSAGVRAVVANRLGAGGESTRARLQRALGAAIVLELPTCPALRDAEDDGRLLPARHRWSRRLAKLAQGLRAGDGLPSA